MARKGRAPLQPFPRAAFTSVAMETGRASMTAPCVRRAGRDAVIFPPPRHGSGSAVSGARSLGTADPLVKLKCAHVPPHVRACVPRCHRGGKYLPRAFATYLKWGANCLVAPGSPVSSPGCISLRHVGSNLDVMTSLRLWFCVCVWGGVVFDTCNTAAQSERLESSQRTKSPAPEIKASY